MTIRPVNIETGEILDGRMCWIPTKRQNGFNEGWVAMSQTAMQEIVNLKATGQITGNDLCVLFALTATLDFENLIIPGPKIGRSRTYRLNPNVGWKGSAKNHKKHLKLISSSPERDPKTRDMWE